MCAIARARPLGKDAGRGAKPCPAGAAPTTFGAPPLIPRSSGGLSSRPHCRIYPSRQVWILELERTSGWLRPADGSHRAPLDPACLVFPTLAAAVGYAARHGLDYRIVNRSGPRAVSRVRRPLPVHRALRANHRHGQTNMER
jgi:hypothetical protein